MVETQSGFCLIDWKLAGRNNEIVFWEGQSLPEDVNLKTRPFVYIDDLRQLGQTIKHLAVPTPELDAFVDGLLSGHIESAQAALVALQEL